MKKLGLDLGSSSNGWALREDDRITLNGVITFHSGMMKGQSGGYTSPTRDRRTARSKRRLIQARKYRKWELLKILLINGFVPLDKQELENWSKYKKDQIQKFPENVKFLKWLACDFAYENGIKYNNPYELRVNALDNKLSKHEFGRALYHLVQRRGYKNIGENDNDEFDLELAKKDAETKTQIERREKEGFAKALTNNRTIAEALQNDFLNDAKRARNQYPLRREYKKELEEICKGQGYDISKNEKEKYNNEFVQKLYNAIIWQRPLRSQKGNIGKCTLEPTKPRCPVSHPIFEIFRALSFINTIKFADKEIEEKQFLSPKIREKLFNDFFLKQDKNFKFEEIRKYLDKEFTSKKIYNYPYNQKEKIYETSVSGMPFCKGLIKVFGEKIKDNIINIDKYNIPDESKIGNKYKEVITKKSKEKLLDKKEVTNIRNAIYKDSLNNASKIINHYSLYDLWHVLFEFDEKHLEKFAIERLKIENEKNKKGQESNPFARLKNNVLQGYSDLSLKAMCNIIPFLKEGFLYNEAAVLAKMPELLGDKWEKQKDIIIKCLKKSNTVFNKNKIISSITNNLIDQYKGLEENIYAYKDYTYEIENKHDSEIINVCKSYFGDTAWENKKDKEEIFHEVKQQYQLFFKDSKRAYREILLLADIFKKLLKENDLEINGNLYHHSNRENLYLKKIKNGKTGEISLPIDKKTGLELLPTPLIDSIKNPMFNKSLTILRKLINELIKTNEVDKDTEIVVEVARELNDNNKRAAIEKYQNERENKREKYRQFLNEFKEKVNSSINVDKSISTFELWTEQTFEEAKNEKSEKVKNKNNSEIHKEKDALKRYELWMEQKGQCMYTGKMISITQLFSNEIDIEHTIPRSILPDNTMTNQTVCYAWYNRDKKQKQFPKQCNNYSVDVEGWGTKIEPRLDNWITTRDNFKEQYEKRLKPVTGENEENKNERIKNKHYFKMHYDYWNDKINRFTADEVKDSWARRQLVDTQMVSKYAREYLKTYFKKVSVQKGSVTADFRKIYSFQEQDEIKGRNKHTHHAIDAAVLTLIPTNSSYRDRVLKKMYETYENERKQYTTKPFAEFNSQTLIENIENKTLIVNFEKDTLLKETSKIGRKRGKIQFVKNKDGEFILNKNGEKIKKIAQGDTVRSSLFKDTFVAKIRDVERYKDGQPMRENGDWKYKKENNEFIYTVRKPIKDVLGKIEDIIDPIIREIVRKQKDNAIDPQGKKIRHVRIETKAGQIVKERINYRSEYDYKNKYYAAAGSLPYAILLQKGNQKNRLTKEGKLSNEKTQRVMIPIASYEVAKMNKKMGKFDIHTYIQEFYSNLTDYPDKKILKTGQKVIVLREDNEYEKLNDIEFQAKRLYRITQFGDGSIYLKYHLEATADDDIDTMVKIKKDQIVAEFDKKYDLPIILEDQTILDIKARKKKYEDDRFRFVGLNDTRFKRLLPFMGNEEVQKLRKNISRYKTQSTSIDIERETPLLKINKGEDWNFLYEGEDFEVSLLGKIIPINK